MRKRIGIPGANGVIDGIRLREVIKAIEGVEARPVMSRFASFTSITEAGLP